MRACATLENVEMSGAKTPERPVVFVDSRPERSLCVERYEARGPLDIRRVTVRAGYGENDACWSGQTAAVALPYSLVDGEAVWLPLLTGRLMQSQEVLAAGEQAERWVIQDDWEAALNARDVLVWTVDHAGGLVVSGDATLGIGNASNRSSKRYDIHGQQVFLPSQENLPWTLGQALQTMSVIHGLGLSLGLLSPSLAETTLSAEVRLGGPIVKTLESICEEHGLVVRRDMSRTVGRFAEHRSIVARKYGRPIHVRSVVEGRPLGRVLKVKTHGRASGARPWVARGGQPRVESTFELSPGWDPSGEGQPDAAYDRVLSDDFSRYHNTYRLWKLGTADASGDGSFDASAFFGQPGVVGSDLRFLDCLTLDDSGSPLPPVVEVSLDGGVLFERYAGTLEILDGQPAVYFDEPTLDGALLSAAKAGELKVRITASLRSPRPIEARRWRGNPFTRVLPSRVLDASERFGWRRVDEQSIHSAAVLAGTLGADVADEREAMSEWLRQRLEREAREPTAGLGEAELTLVSTWPWLVVGDRLRGVLTHDGEPMPAVSYEAGATATVSRLCCDFEPSPVTRVTVNY